MPLFPNERISNGGKHVRVDTSGNVIATGTAVTLGGTSTGATITTAEDELVLEQTGDTLGTTRLRIQNRNGFNGAIFQNPSLDLIDFIFSPSTATARNIRFEGRSAFTFFGSAGEFQFGNPASFTLVIGTAGSTGVGILNSQRLYCSGEVEIDGALNHDGTTVGLYGVTPVARPTAYTQTYATADRTHANPTATTLTHSVGTADGTVADVGASFNQTTLNNNFKEFSTQGNALVADMADIKQLVNAILDDLQAVGICQ